MLLENIIKSVVFLEAVIMLNYPIKKTSHAVSQRRAWLEEGEYI